MFLEPGDESGRLLFERRITGPVVAAAEGELRFVGSGGFYLIGPLDER
jgi:hypothetical protein